MVTARANLMDKVNGLQAGADDYLTKPFAIPELVARVQAQLRRYRHQTRLGLPVAGLKLAELEIDFVRRRVRQQEQEIRLSSIEYRLLEYLARNVEYVLAHDLLVEKVWGSEQVGDHHLLHLTVNRLRQKLGTSRHYLQTRPGLGLHPDGGLSLEPNGLLGLCANSSMALKRGGRSSWSGRARACQ